MATRFFAKEILNEFLRIANDSLRASLGLKGAYKGSLKRMPTDGLTDMVPGIWFNMTDIKNAPIAIPAPLEQTYSIRAVHIGKVNVNENFLDKKIDNAKTIFDTLLDNFRLPSLTLSGNPPAQVLWSMVRTVDLEPPEDDGLGELASDIIATAMNIEVVVRTRRE